MSEKKLHGLFVVFFVMIAVFLTLGRVGTAFNSFALLTPDLGAYVSLAVAQDHPQFFIHDPFLSNEKNTNSNDMIYIPLIRALKPIFGNYGAVCVFLLPIFIFIHLLGYYVLGVSIFKNPWAGLVISLLISAPINTYYDYWGLILDALPRFLYQGAIPFLLALSIVRGNNPKWWPVIMAGLGALNYIHPLDTPAWALAFTFGLWLSASKVEFWYKVRMMALAIIVLAVILTPFILNYVGSTVKTTSEVVNYSQTLAILQARFSTMSTISLPAILSNFFINPQGVIFDLIWYSVCVLALVGVVYGLASYKISKEPAFILQITGWILGVFIGSCVVPSFEQTLFAYLKKIPPEFELLRTFRYIVPLILLAAFSALWMIKNELHRRNFLTPIIARTIMVIASMCLLLAWGVRGELQRREFRSAIHQNISCWTHAQIVCPLPQGSLDYIGILDFVREKTPSGARIFSEGQDVAIRYYALRPLVYTYKDGAPLAYTNSDQLLRWSVQQAAIDKLAYIRKFPFRRKEFMKGVVELAKNSGADYLILSETYDLNLFYPDALEPIYSNDRYSLYKINP